MTPAATSGWVSTDTGNPSELAVYASFALNRILGQSHKFSWQLTEYSLALTGASSYNLKTLIPDLDRILQAVGDGLPGRDGQYLSPYDFNVQVGGTVFTIKNNILEFKNPPTSGTLIIPYFSQYAVADSDGVRKRYFEDATDFTFIPNTHIDTLIEMILEYVYRKTSKGQFVRTVLNYDGRQMQVTPGVDGLNRMILDDNNIHEVVKDFRFRII